MPRWAWLECRSRLGTRNPPLAGMQMRRYQRVSDQAVWRRSDRFPILPAIRILWNQAGVRALAFFMPRTLLRDDDAMARSRLAVSSIEHSLSLQATRRLDVAAPTGAVNRHRPKAPTSAPSAPVRSRSCPRYLTRRFPALAPLALLPLPFDHQHTRSRRGPIACAEGQPISPARMHHCPASPDAVSRSSNNRVCTAASANGAAAASRASCLARSVSSRATR